MCKSPAFSQILKNSNTSCNKARHYNSCIYQVLQSSSAPEPAEDLPHLAWCTGGRGGGAAAMKAD